MSGQGSSGILPKKAHVIEDVGAGTVVDLKATVFQANEDRKYNSGRGINSERRGKDKKETWTINSGVNARAARDNAEIIAERVDIQRSEQALIRKTNEYEEMARKARIGDDDGYDPRYSVDFEGKAFEVEQGRAPSHNQLIKRSEQHEAPPVAFVEALTDKLNKKRPEDDGTSEDYPHRNSKP